MIIYIENPKETIRKFLELISEFSKVVGYTVNTQKSLALLYTNNEKSERESKESIPLTIATKRIKYLGINPPGSEVKASTYNVGDLGLIPGSGRYPEEGNGNPLWYSCLENHMEGGAW